ncbi:MFS general substrate transporter [Mycena polygramma]|nr:MFS general substrate transporter [Mycena polygramma]
MSLSTSDPSNVESADAKPSQPDEKLDALTTSQAVIPPHAMDEGGWRAWMTVVGAALALFSTFGVALAFGVFQDFYTREYLSEKTPSDISWIGSTQLFLDFAIGLPSGRLHDAGHFRLLMASGTLLYIFSFFMLSITQPHHYYQVFLCQGIGMGLALGLIIVPAVSVPSHYFRARRSLVMGIVFAGSSFGGVLVPIMVNNLIKNHGFPWAIRITAFTIMGLLILSNLLMTPRYPPRLASVPTIRTIEFFKDVPFLIAVSGASLVYLGLFFPYFYLQLFSVLQGIDETSAFYSLTVLNIATILGRTLPNAIADRYGAINVLIPMTATAGALVFAMLGVSTTAGMFVFALVYGFFSGSFPSLLTAVLAGFSRSVHEIGTRIGVGMAVIGLALLIGNPITGALLTPPKYTWWAAITFSGVVMLAGVMLLVVARQLAAKERGTWRL